MLCANKYQDIFTCLVILTQTHLIKTLKPYSKRQQEIWRLECELGVISDPQCPVDGGWSPWGPWTACHGACDDIGHRRRTRRCNNPPPTEDGIPCNGLEDEIEPCYLTNCTLKHFKRLVEGDFARTEAYHQLEAVPALMERCLQMECPYEAIEAALASDNTWQLNPEDLWNSLQCVKHNMGCPVVGEWGTWGAWSSCGARCGEGLRWRLRRCDTPAPSAAYLVCTGSPLEAEECEGDQCAIDVRVIERDANADWSEWGPWSACSENCGLGVWRRRRTCNEYLVPRTVGSWGTHCAGQHDEFEMCERKDCLLDGGWSGWGAWGPCTKTCGTGKRTRTRSCTRPMPAGGGNSCVGLRAEIGSCYLNPCEVHSHIVALLNGESLLQYNFQNRRSTLLHFYARFMPLSPHGTLVRRGTVHSPHVRLSLQKRHICLDASGFSPSCSLPRICSPTIVEPAVWHTVLITVTSEAATLRVDDVQVPIKGTFPCDPELPDEPMNILVGEKFRGGIQELVLNFIPLDMVIERERRKFTGFCPTTALNIVYEKPDMEEAYLLLDNDQYLRVPCFDNQEEWRLEFTIKSKREAGTIVFLRDEVSGSWLHMGLQNMRLKLKVAHGDFRSETSSCTDCLPNQWLDVTLAKKKHTNIVEASINAVELLHVVVEDDATRDRREFKSYQHESLKACDIAEKKKEIARKSMSLTLCNDEFFVGGIPTDKGHVSDEFTPFAGVIASISINNVLQDLHDFSIELNKDDGVQVSSRTASVSDSYHEISWGKSNRLNLTCLHARTARSPHTAEWLFLDTGIKRVIRDMTVRSVDDGRVLRLVASADNDLRGFYTCRAHTSKRTRNVVTYGVIGKIKYHLSSPDTITAIAVVTTLTLIVGTLAWLIIEGIYDLRNGFGFFRDAHLSPEEEAEAVCKYIDENIHLIGSQVAADIAKARARRKGRRLASRISLVAQEPQGLKQMKNEISESSTSSSSAQSEPKGLPELPEISSAVEASHEVYRCEPSYISSPRHGSNLTTPRTRFTSSSSHDPTSPRVLCSRLLLAKRIYSPREALVMSKRNKSFYSNHFDSPQKTRSNLPTIKSSACIELSVSPAHKILQKFKELKNDDD